MSPKICRKSGTMRWHSKRSLLVKPKQERIDCRSGIDCTILYFSHRGKSLFPLSNLRYLKWPLKNFDKAVFWSRLPPNAIALPNFFPWHQLWTGEREASILFNYVFAKQTFLLSLVFFTEAITNRRLTF